MYTPWQLAFKYLRYYLSASNGKGHGMHSPFIFQFIKNVLNDDQDYPDYNKVEKIRKALLKDPSSITVEDLGAGSSLGSQKLRVVSTIARHSAKSPKLASLLYRMVKTYQPHNILELGTSLGLTTSYLSLANPGASIMTIEGSEAVARLAKKNWEMMELKNIELRIGNFDQLLAGTLKDMEVVDFAFIDGNHQQEPTQRYFEILLSGTNNDSILVFDDIHWSRGMEEAWDFIKNHPATRVTIDLFFIGIVFFRQEFKEKQHVSIRF